MATKEYLLTRAALGDPAILMQLDVGKVGFRIDRIVIDDGRIKVLLHNGSVFTARCAEVLDATIHICQKIGVCMKLKFVGGDLTEVS